jgi:DNA topoisomerase-3
MSRADNAGPCQFPTLGFVVDQFNRVQSFVPETFWYINVAIEREDEDNPDPNAAPRLVDFKWRRNHLFDEDVVALLFEQVQAAEAVVERVETKPTTKWYVLSCWSSLCKVVCQGGSRKRGDLRRKTRD